MAKAPTEPSKTGIDTDVANEIRRAHLGSWAFVHRRLMFRFQPDPAAPIRCGLALGAGLEAQIVLGLTNGTVTVGPAQYQSWGKPFPAVVAAARANTVTQPIHRLTTTVLDGPDQGSRIDLLIGGPCISGLVVDLHRVVDPFGTAEPLVVVGSDQVIIVGQFAPAVGAEGRQTLALRLASLAAEAERGDVIPVVFRFPEPGRLAMFRTEDR